MNEALRHGGPDFLHRFAGLRDRLPGDADMRDRAAESFARLGLPTQRLEEWKYTNLRPLAETTFFEPMLPVTDAPPLLAGLETIDAPRLVFVDGRFRPDLSSADYPAFAQRPQFGHLARPDRDAFAALNTMLAEDGARIVIPPGVDAGTLQIVNIATDMHERPVAFHPRHSIELGAGAKLVLIDSAVGEGTYLHAPVSEIMVGDRAHLTHLRLQDESRAAFHMATLYVDIGARAIYDSFLLTLGARLSRTDIHARVEGQHASVHLNCAQLLRGTQHGDFTTHLAHNAPNGRSRQTVRNVLDGNARGVFQGRIDVAQAAQKTDGYQMNHALLLSPDAEVDTKPELRINADDVKCSHGATVGALDADQLFYLRSRGVPEAQARAMLIRGFLAESLAEITHEPGRALLDAAIGRWWDRAA